MIQMHFELSESTTMAEASLHLSRNKFFKDLLLNSLEKSIDSRLA
jgi:hypothetical protein